MKPMWEKPKLLVLARNTPQEAVLAFCKTTGVIGPGKTGCKNAQGPDNCSQIGNS